MQTLTSNGQRQLLFGHLGAVLRLTDIDATVIVLHVIEDQCSGAAFLVGAIFG